MEREVRIIKEIDWEMVKEEIKNSSKNSSIYLGVDSQQHKGISLFGLAVVLHIESCKGGKLFVEKKSMPKITSMRQRLMKEVEFAVMGALNIIDIVGDRRFEVHLDVSGNPEHGSNVICKEAIGYVLGQGLECKVKPFSWCASHAADRLVK